MSEYLHVEKLRDRRVVLGGVAPGNNVVRGYSNYPQAGPKIARRETHNLESERGVGRVGRVQVQLGDSRSQKKHGVGRVQLGDPGKNVG